MRNFISPVLIKKVKISLQKKSNAYEVTVIEDELLSYNNKMINYKIKEIRLQIRPHI